MNSLTYHIFAGQARSGIWRLKVPPKVKNLVWRMCRGCLPTRIRLHDKGVHCPTDCVNCDSGQEDFAHLFFACPFAIQVWTRASLWTDIDFAVATAHTAEEAIFSLLQNLSTVRAKHMVMLLWSLWKCRNLKVREDVTKSCAAVIEHAKVLRDDWEFANSLRTDVQPAPHIFNNNLLLMTVQLLFLRHLLLLNHNRSSGSPLRVVGSNVTLTRLFLSPIIVQVLVFVFGMTNGLLFLPKL
jgi:hypothetical protein